MSTKNLNLMGFCGGFLAKFGFGANVIHFNKTARRLNKISFLQDYTKTPGGVTGDVLMLYSGRRSE